jgi:putative phosphoesterase
MPSKMPGARNRPPSETLRIGLVSDTHGLLRAEALERLRDSDFLIHAGDIGDPAILDRLAEIAPITAVRGNNDSGPWASAIPDTALLRAGAASIYVIHNVAELDIDPAAAGFQAVVAGHSHRPAYELRDGVLFVNPGSAGPRRFKLPVCVGCLFVSGTTLTPRLIELDV